MTENLRNTCQQCPANSGSAKLDRYTCVCDDGFFETGYGYNLQCHICLPGSYAQSGQRDHCLLCAVGTFTADFGSATCSECAVGNYTDQTNQTRCIKCPRGRTTALTGADHLGYCFDPAANFGWGIVASLLAPIAVVLLLYKDRFVWLMRYAASEIVRPVKFLFDARHAVLVTRAAAARLFRGVQRHAADDTALAVTAVDSVTAATDSNDIVLSEFENVAADANGVVSSVSETASVESANIMNIPCSDFIRFGKCASFVLISIAVLVLVLIPVQYYLVMCYVLFNALLLSRGLLVLESKKQFGQQLLVVQSTFEESLDGTGGVAAALVRPVVKVLTSLSEFNVLDQLNVTCKGAQGSFQFLVNVLIFTVFLTVIEAGFQIIWRISIIEAHWDCVLHSINRIPPLKHIVFTLPSCNWSTFKKRYLREICYVIFSVLALALFALKPHFLILQFIMGYVNLVAFTKTPGIPHHAVSYECDLYDGFPNADSFFGYFATTCCWLLVFPVTYQLSASLLPGYFNMHSDKRTRYNEQRLQIHRDWQQRQLCVKGLVTWMVVFIAVLLD